MKSIYEHIHTHLLVVTTNMMKENHLRSVGVKGDFLGNLHVIVLLLVLLRRSRFEVLNRSFSLSRP